MPWLNAWQAGRWVLIRTISLYTGAGGLDLGLEQAGFSHVGCVEVDGDARKTLQANRPDWPLARSGDIHDYTADALLDHFGIRGATVDLLAGGPPCQPFSKSRFWRTEDRASLSDPRARTLRAFLKVAYASLPRAVLIENVEGITYRNNREAVRFIERSFDTINAKSGTSYRVHYFNIDASHYGVPQSRRRTFLVASRDGRTFSLPKPTHGAGGEPFLTAWDAIGALGDPPTDEPLAPTGKWAGLLPSIPEGENYLWHTSRGGGMPLFGWRTRYWSFLLKLKKDKPSWTIVAQPGGSTGPFHWSNRRLSTRELCRLQTFPDSYRVHGSYRSAVRQIGNAVPPALGELIGKQIRVQFFDETVNDSLVFVPRRRGDTPPPDQVQPVPSRFYRYLGDHPDHPGAGYGPGVRGRG